MRLDELSKGGSGQIAAIDWARLREGEAKRLRELGFDEGVAVRSLHRGPLAADPLAFQVGRMTVAIRRALASTISVEVVTTA